MMLIALVTACLAAFVNVCSSFQLFPNTIQPAQYSCHQAPHWANITIEKPITFSVFGSQVTRCLAGTSQHSNAWNPIETVCATTKLFNKVDGNERIIGACHPTVCKTPSGIEYGCLSVETYTPDGCGTVNSYARHAGTLSQTCICRTALCNTVDPIEVVTKAPDDPGIKLISSILKDVGDWVAIVG